MPVRFVTAPKAHVYTRNTRDSKKGVTYRLTPWVVSGRVDRKINQVSSAEVTLRNPQRKFTQASQGVAFYPMDPITIYLERIPGYPVRVFTGYLDETPYHQLYPGTVTLKASCTLKKLLYTYFDPSLPTVLAWLGQYGWFSTGDGSLLNMAAFDSAFQNGTAGVGQGASGQAGSGGGGNSGQTSKQQLQDPSIGKLVWASLYEIAQWQDSYIYVESLPEGIVDRVSKLLAKIAQQNKAGADAFTYFMKQVLQSSSGTASGTTPSGSTVAAGSLPCVTREAATKYGVPLDVLWGVAGKETNFGKNITDSSAGAKGAFQFIQSTAAQYNYPYTNNSDPDTLAKQADAAARKLSHDSNGGDWAAAIVAYGGGYSLGDVQAMAASNPIPACNQSSSAGSGLTGSVSTTSSSVSSQSGSTAPASSTNTSTSGAIWPLGGQISWERTDEGVDASQPPNMPVFACVDGTVSSVDPYQFGHGDIIFIDSPGLPGGATGIYYSEGVRPSVKTGQKVKQGQQIGTTYTGTDASTATMCQFEFGFSKGIQTLAAATTGYSEGQVTQAGLLFRSFISAPADGSSTNKPGPVGGSTGTAAPSREDATAGAFVGAINFPTAEDMTLALALGLQHKGLMHDQSLMPWVQQLTQASLRSFQSLPDGSFYAFYPDYFGEFGHHDAYWNIRDIEILDGGVNLTDDTLFTHVYAVGENIWPAHDEFVNQVFMSGEINIFNAYEAGLTANDANPLISTEEAVQFIKRYGARPLVKDYPMVRSNIFETLLAYQQFMYAWSNQFQAPFQFTFMPEIFPGGKVGFPDHGLQMYVESVTHTWDYESAGFTTDAQLSAPSLLHPKDDPAKWDLPPTFVRALVEPLKQPGAPTLTQQEQQAVQQINRGQAPLLSQQPPWMQGPTKGSPFSH